MRLRATALASDALSEAAAREHLEAGGRALGAVLAGFFAAAGASAGVLLGPVSVLVAGTGQGARAFDGRARQPGLGTKRPRGFADADSVPEAAGVPAPAALAAAFVAHAYGGDQSLRAVVRPGIAAAERASAPARAALLERVAQIGASVLLEASYRRPILRVGGASEGGLVTPSDLEPPADIDVPAVELEAGSDERRWVVPPWAWTDGELPAELGRGGGIVAVDTYGVLAALTFRTADAGVWIEEHQLIAPRLAVPVRRGVPRVAPGVRLPAPAPMAVHLDEGMRPIAIVVEPESARFDPSAPGTPRLLLRRDPATRLVAAERR